jgi:hypothetical protein
VLIWQVRLKESGPCMGRAQAAYRA